MLALSSLSDRPSEMIHITVTRAKMCELADLIKPLPLNEVIVSALLEHKGIKSEALKCVLAYEISDFANAIFLNLASYDIYVAQVEAITWANMVTESL